MRKERILFVIHTMNIGGVEKALLGMLSQYAPETHEVTVLMLEKKGEYLSFLPAWVKTGEIPEYKKLKKIVNEPPLSLISYLIRICRFCDAARLFWAYICYKITNSQFVLYNMIMRHIKPLCQDFDVAIAYASPFPFIDYYIVKKVYAKKKYAWIHYDVSKFYIDKKIIHRLYRLMDKIFVVSQQGKNNFDRLFPSLSTKTEVYYNVIEEKLILHQANEYCPYQNEQRIKICTVGRVAKEKGQMMTLDVLRRLVDDGLDVVWYYVGEGNDYFQCLQRKNILELGSNAVFVGAKTNPYPYMKGCDIYVQPSLHEGYCITLAEAKLFNHPIVATNFTGASEQLQSVRDSIVVDINVQSLYEGVLKMLRLVER